jgi:hypothetical protein
MAIPEALEADGDQYAEVVWTAYDAASKGWQEAGARAMGQRQALIADLEAGASQIPEYQQTIIPGLLQTPEFTHPDARARTVTAGLGRIRRFRVLGNISPAGR